MLGRVKWFNKWKKYGFIIGTDEVEYFIHWSEIQKDGYKCLETDQVVEFEAVETKAVNVWILGKLCGA